MFTAAIVVGAIMAAAGAAAVGKGIRTAGSTPDSMDDREAQMMENIRNEAQGRFSGPSVADLVLKDAMEKQEAAAFSLATSQQGQAPGLAMKTAQEALGRGQRQAISSTQALALQERMQKETAAREQLIGIQAEQARQEAHTIDRKTEMWSKLGGGLMGSGGSMMSMGMKK